MDRSLGENLIFIISQPRAGSTLLQRILGNHPDLHTVSEPWLMLHPFYCLECQGFRAEYNEVVAQSAVQNFLGTLPNREDEYFEGVRRMYTYLYESSLATAGKRYFLDKTPRYYFVIPQLYRTFPKAHFLILYRNPLAVLCSIISAWAKENWFALFQFKHDLIRAPGLLNEGIQFLGERAMVVHYEELVVNAERGIQDICKTIEEFRFIWEGKSFSVKASAGLVAIDKHVKDSTKLMSAADSACYIAKERGRNTIHLYQFDDEAISKRHSEMVWVSRINEALLRNQFELYFQPIIHRKDTDCCSFIEFLLRLRQPGQNDNEAMVLPGAFIPAAERYDLMLNIDRWVTKNALDWLSKNSHRHPQLKSLYQTSQIVVYMFL